MESSLSPRPQLLAYTTFALSWHSNRTWYSYQTWKIDSSTNASKELGRSWWQTPGNQAGKRSPEIHRDCHMISWRVTIGPRVVALSLRFMTTFEHMMSDVFFRKSRDHMIVASCQA